MSIFEDDTLTQGQRLVWFAVQELATSGVCRLGPSGIAEHMGSGRAHVSRCLSRLASRGWIERTESGGLVPIEEPTLSDVEQRDSKARASQARDRDSKARKDGEGDGFSFSPFPASPTKEYHSTPYTLTPSSFSEIGGSASADYPPWLERLVENRCWTAEPLPDDHPARWEYHQSDWKWVAADWVLGQLEANDMLNSHYQNRLEDERRGKIASEWADEIRKLVELDGHSRDDVRITLGWLLKTENWWRENRTIQSMGSLRKKGDDGSTKFDKILQSALADYEQRERNQIDPEAIRDGFSNGENGESTDPAGDAVPDEQAVGVRGFEW